MNKKDENIILSPSGDLVKAETKSDDKLTLFNGTFIEGGFKEGELVVISARSKKSKDFLPDTITIDPQEVLTIDLENNPVNEPENTNKKCFEKTTIPDLLEEVAKELLGVNMVNSVKKDGLDVSSLINTNFGDLFPDNDPGPADPTAINVTDAFSKEALQYTIFLLEAVTLDLEYEKNKIKDVPYYNTKPGIYKSLESLESFLKMVEDRRDAHYKREEHLDSFFILGRYYTDSCGNFMIATANVPAERYPEFSKFPLSVINDREFEKLEKISTFDLKNLWFGMGSRILPELNVVCASCGEKWGIENVHDVTSKNISLTKNAEEFIGMTLRGVKAYYDRQTDADYWIRNDLTLRNDRYIDLSPKYPDDPNMTSIKKNEFGCVGMYDSKECPGCRAMLTDDYIIQKGDELYIEKWLFYHKKCNRKTLHDDEKKMFEKMFLEAGFKNVTLTAIPNQYCHDEKCTSCAPYFEVKTKWGNIIIGWRKRVFSINWEDIIKYKRDGDETFNREESHSLDISGYLIRGLESPIKEAFKDENVTKDVCSIHAWGSEKCIEYLKKVREIFESFDFDKSLDSIVEYTVKDEE